MAIKAKGIAKPTLHPMDRTIYVLMIVFSLAANVLLLTIMKVHGDRLCLAEEGIVAYWYNGGLWMVPLLVYFDCGVIVYAADRLRKRVPLFYPLQYESRCRRSEPHYNVRRQRAYSIVVIAVGLICFALCFVPDDARWVMEADGTVRKYNNRSEVTSFLCVPERAEKVSLEAHKASGGRKSIQAPKLILRVAFTDKTEHFMELDDFIDADEAIGFMERFMAGLDDGVPVSRTGRDNINIVANYYNLSSSQTSRLYALFEK